MANMSCQHNICCSKPDWLVLCRKLIFNTLPRVDLFCPSADDTAVATLSQCR